MPFFSRTFSFCHKEAVSPPPQRPSNRSREPSPTRDLQLSEANLKPRSRVEPSPWSVHYLNLLPRTVLSKSARPSGPSPSPFPRFGYTLSATASASGELFLFGGYLGGSASKDSYAFLWWDLSATLSATLLQTSGEVPSPRLRHAGARFDTVLLIWGGATNVSDQGEIIGPYDDSLYLLDIGTSSLFDAKTDFC